jgi:hypothetical protein
MLIAFNRQVNFGDLFITSKGGYFLVVRNIFSDKFPVLIVDLAGNKSDDEFTKLEDIKYNYDIVEVIPSNLLILTKEDSNLC